MSVVFVDEFWSSERIRFVNDCPGVTVKEMIVSGFTFVVTDDCNYRCNYCPQKKEKKYIDSELAKKASDFVYPFLADRSTIGFYGGEPLLCFDQIKDTVRYLERKNSGKKKIGFSITTNGSLLDKKKNEFLHLNRFSVILSFDGRAHNVSRKSGDFEWMVARIEEIRKYSHINLRLNSVFSPGTVGYLAESIRLFLELGVNEIRYALSTIEEWDDNALEEYEVELLKMVELLVANYKEKQSIPVESFRSPGTGKGLFGCSAGKDRMVVTPDGKLWGCYVFHDYFKGKEDTEDYSKYCFGDLDHFLRDRESLYPEVLSNYARLRMDNFQCEDSYCFLCGDIFSCRVCPVNAAYVTSELGKVPAWICKINRIQMRVRDELQRRIGEV